MIPKKIHFCWLSGDEFSPLIKHCIESWRRVLPDYEIVIWDTEKFDINSVAWVKEAYEAKKYAFAADYIRVYALYTEGGIYLDSDVEMLKSFNPLLNFRTFIGYEASTNGIEAAIMGAEAGMIWCKNAIDFYHEHHFSMDYVRENNLLAPNVICEALQMAYPDWVFVPPKEETPINNGELLICPSHYFSPITYDIEKSYSKQNSMINRYRLNPETYCIHLFNASWTQCPNRIIQIWEYVKKHLLALFN